MPLIQTSEFNCTCTFNRTNTTKKVQYVLSRMPVLEQACLLFVCQPVVTYDITHDLELQCIDSNCKMSLRCCRTDWANRN